MKNYTEEWIAIVNKNKYYLNEKQAALLKQEIARGNRGIVLFDEFSINIPYMEELYLNRKIFNESTLLSNSIPYLSSEEIEKGKTKLAEIRSKWDKKKHNMEKKKKA